MQPNSRGAVRLPVEQHAIKGQTLRVFEKRLHGCVRRRLHPGLAQHPSESSAEAFVVRADRDGDLFGVLHYRQGTGAYRLSIRALLPFGEVLHFYSNRDLAAISISAKSRARFPKAADCSRTQNIAMLSVG